MKTLQITTEQAAMLREVVLSTPAQDIDDLRKGGKVLDAIEAMDNGELNLEDEWFATLFRIWRAPRPWNRKGLKEILALDDLLKQANG
jgi:hypothetical protein